MYTKNRSLDILAGLFVSNIVFACGRVKEGMKGGVEKVMEGADMHTEAKKKVIKKKKCCKGSKIS